MDVGHFLVGDFGDESRPHRHDYEVELRFEVEQLDERGFSVDIALMKEFLAEIAAELAGTLLNDHPFFSERQTSVENFARFVHTRLVDLAGRQSDNPFDGSASSEVVVWEADNAWASYVAPASRPSQ